MDEGIERTTYGTAVDMWSLGVVVSLCVCVCVCVCACVCACVYDVLGVRVVRVWCVCVWRVREYSVCLCVCFCVCVCTLSFDLLALYF